MRARISAWGGTGARDRAAGETRYRLFCEHLAQRLNAILSTGVAAKRPELTAVYRAMMLGQKHELNIEQDQLFMHSGTMHLFAINGLHIGIVAVAVHALLLLARCPRLLVAGLTLHSPVARRGHDRGSRPSAVRAWLLVVAYGYLRADCRPMASRQRQQRSWVLLADPMALFSASFQMSYGVKKCSRS